MQRRYVIAASTVLACAVLTGCTAGDVPVTAGPTQKCERAAVTALDKEQVLYDTHPLWDAEIPGVDATDKERAKYDALQADEEAQWTAIYAPVYAECESPADWWAAAKEHPGIAGVTDADFLEPDSLRNWCTGSEEQPACQGIDDWLDTNPR